MSNEHKPYISPSTILPEITLKAIVLGFILSAVLASANAYLGLYLGMTVSASIPAAVVSMVVLRFFRRSNILENNIVQTSASAGESLAAGVIFTFPALVIMGYWQGFNYLETALIALCGGVLGVLFTIPLRQALIVKEKLKFPEGIATAEVLKIGTQGGQLIKYLISGSIVGAVVKFVIDGFHLWSGKFELGTIVAKSKGFLYFGVNLSPAVMAVGYIVGLNISLLVFIGGAISWYFGIPYLVGVHGADHYILEIMEAKPSILSPADVSVKAIGMHVWSNYIRYLGVGGMIVGGLWAIISIRSSLVNAVKQGFAAFKKTNEAGAKTLRTEYDTPMSWVMIGVGVMIIPIFIIYYREVASMEISALMSILMVIAGFLFSAVAGYMAGLVGSSNNPISGVTIATILTSALILAALVGTDSEIGAASSILIGAVVCCAAAIAGDNMQDLKAGHILGATPRNQQIMQMVGVLAAAFSLPWVMDQLHTAYGIGSSNLPAPQASLMMSVAQGIFGGELPWGTIGIGAGIGILIIIADQVLAARGSSFRMPVLAVAVGMYLPLYLDTAILFGGVIAWLIHRRTKSMVSLDADKKLQADNSGLLFASGLITGEALLGIALAIIFVYFKPTAEEMGVEANEIMKLFKEPLAPRWAAMLQAVGFAVLLAICYYLYRIVVKGYEKISA